MKDEEKVEFEIEDESVQEVQNEQKEDDVEIVDDTPEQDRDKEHLGDVEIPEDEISQYSKNVQYRLKQLSRNVHDERREKERLMREHPRSPLSMPKPLRSKTRQLPTKTVPKANQFLLKAIRTGLTPASHKPNETIRMRMRLGIPTRCWMHRRGSLRILLNKGR